MQTLSARVRSSRSLRVVLPLAMVLPLLLPGCVQDHAEAPALFVPQEVALHVLDPPFRLHPWFGLDWNGTALRLAPVSAPASVPFLDVRPAYEIGVAEGGGRLLLDDAFRPIVAVTEGVNGTTYAFPRVGPPFPDVETFVWLLPASWVLTGMPEHVEWLGNRFEVGWSDGVLRASLEGTRIAYVYRFQGGSAIPTEAAWVVHVAGEGDVDRRVVWAAEPHDPVGQVEGRGGPPEAWWTQRLPAAPSEEGLPADEEPSRFAFSLRAAVEYARTCQETPVVAGFCEPQVKTRLAEPFAVATAFYVRSLAVAGEPRGSTWLVTLAETEQAPAFGLGVDEVAGPAPAGGSIRNSYRSDPARETARALDEWETVPLSDLLARSTGVLGEVADVRIHVTYPAVAPGDSLSYPTFVALATHATAGLDMRNGLPVWVESQDG